jgi:hypothetical protein
MFNRLKQKWNVSGGRFILIIATFALGGSLCGYAGRRVLALFAIDNPWLRVPLYILLMTLLWPLCILLVSGLLGQFSFFKTFLGRLANRLRGKASSPQ